jgi:glycosyltransferase involved in cell wall biosynthesis
MKSNLLLVGSFLAAAGANRSIGEELADRLSQEGYSVILTSERRSRLLRLFDMLATTWRRRNDYEVAYVEVYSGPAFLWAELVCLALKLIHKPYVLALHGGNLPAFAKRWPGRVRRLLESAHKVTAPSSYLRDALRRYQSDIALIPNPVEIDQYSFRLRSKPVPHLIWLRAFHALYNPQIAPLIVEKIRQSFPEIKLTMVGPDKGDHSLQATRDLIETLGLETSIEIIPGVPKAQVPDILSQSDIFINTTTVDNTPVSLIEAMACGLCIVSTNVGGLPYLVDHGREGLLLPPNDVDAMAVAIHRIMTEQGLAGSLSRNARSKAENFSWEKILPVWMDLFNNIQSHKNKVRSSRHESNIV